MATPKNELEIQRNNIRVLMNRGLRIPEMVEHLRELEGRRFTHQNIYQRIWYMLENKLVTASDVMNWKKLQGKRDALKIIERFGLE